jgi:hypothetical protein
VGGHTNPVSSVIKICTLWTQLTSGITASAVEKPFIRDPNNSSRTSPLKKKIGNSGRTSNSRDSNNNTIINRDANSNRGAKNSMTPTTHDFLEKFAGKLFRTAQIL